MAVVNIPVPRLQVPAPRQPERRERCYLCVQEMRAEPFSPGGTIPAELKLDFWILAQSRQQNIIASNPSSRSRYRRKSP